MTAYDVVQDGTAFELYDPESDELIDTITAPQRAWYDIRHNQTRQEVEVKCRAWFRGEYCPPRGIEPIFRGP